MSLLATGTALAMVLGLPLGRVIGQYLGWRVTFFDYWRGCRCGYAGDDETAARAAQQSCRFAKSVPELFKRPALLCVYGLTVVVVTAHFTAYSYIEPFVQKVALMSDGFITALLLLFGGAGILGSMLFSRYSNKYPAGFLIAAIALLFLCLLLLLPLSFGRASLSLVCFVWGVAIMAIGLSMQVKVLTLAPMRRTSPWRCFPAFIMSASAAARCSAIR